MRQEVIICLDEIDACYDRIENGCLTTEQIKKIKSWARKQKKLLCEMGYKGKIRRQPKITSKRINKGSLFEE